MPCKKYWAFLKLAVCFLYKNCSKVKIAIDDCKWLWGEDTGQFQWVNILLQNSCKIERTAAPLPQGPLPWSEPSLNLQFVGFSYHGRGSPEGP